MPLLIADRNELTFDEIKDALNISKSATSTAINLLINTNRIEYAMHTMKKRTQKSSQRILAGNPVWRAFAQKPMPHRRHTGISLTSMNAFDELLSGNGTRTHASRMFVACNMGFFLAEMGCGPEFKHEIQNAQAAISACQGRALKGLGYILDPNEADALRKFLGIHLQQTELASEA